MPVSGASGDVNGRIRTG